MAIHGWPSQGCFDRLGWFIPNRIVSLGFMQANCTPSRYFQIQRLDFLILADKVNPFICDFGHYGDITNRGEFEANGLFGDLNFDASGL